MRGTTKHIGLSVRGVLRQGSAELRRLLPSMTKDDGKPFDSITELREALFDSLAEGREILPFGECDNWDWKTGCGGHPSQD